ncbi:MAG: acyltransferase family protein, partial [Halioglobus sp.]
PGSSFTRILGGRIFVGLGLISYSFYLWHFPIFAFSRIGGAFASNTEKIAITAVALGVSIVSYYCIEKPARNPNTIARRPFFIILFLVFTALVSGGAVILKLDGIPGRLGVFSNLFAEAAIEKLTQGDRACNRFSDEPCRFLMPEATSTLISVGDSQAAAISAQLLKSAARNNANFVQLTQAACLLIKGTTRFDDNRPHEKCLAATAFANDFLENSPPATIVYTGRFPLHINGERFDNGEGGVESGPSPRLSANDATLAVTDVAQQMIRGWLAHGHTVVLVYPIPEVGWNLPKLVASKIPELADDQLTRDFPLLRHLDITTSYRVFKAWAKPSVQMLDGVGENSNLLRVYPAGIFCEDSTQRCLTHDQEHFYYSDDNHLSAVGARLLVAEIEAVLGWKADSGEQPNAPQDSD